MKKKNVEGFFLLLETKKQEMIFIEENNECHKPWKKKGQRFCPGGTKEDGENIEETIEREILEETGLNGDATIVKKTLQKIGELFLETDEFYIKAHVYKGSISHDTNIKAKKFNSHEIESITVEHPSHHILNQKIDKIRPGLIEALLLTHGIQQPKTIYIKDGVYANQEEIESKIEQLQVLYNNTK